MRLALLAALFASTLARADTSMSAASVSSPLHALARAAGGGRARPLAHGGEFLAVREGIEVLVPRQLAYHRLLLETSRGWFSDGFGDKLLDDDAGRSRNLVGPMIATVERGVLLVRGRRAIWKRDDFPRRRLTPTYSCEEWLVACLVAADGAPRCSAPLLVGDESDCDEADAEGGGNWSVRHWDWQLAASVQQTDRIALRIMHGHPPRPHEARVVELR